MSTRILENRRNRLTTIMIIPLMSCGARFTIYMLIIPAFFPPVWQGPMLWLIYLIGIVLAVICARILRLTAFKGETASFVMELPPYRMPTFKAITLHTWYRGSMYLRKAGTIILGLSILLWFANSYPKPDSAITANLSARQAHELELEYSAVGRLGRIIEPVLKPIGFDWKIGTAFISALAAKEVFVSQLGIIYAVGQESGQPAESLHKELRNNYSRLTAFCILLFSLITAPCAATVAVTKIETGLWRWALLQFFGLTALGYVLTFVVFQAGSMIIKIAG